MKIAITGKGGVGKTTLAAALIHLFTEKGYRVLAVDADPDANLAAAVGFSDEEREGIVPLAAMKDLVAKRTGAAPGTTGGFFKLNPKVDDIPDHYCLSRDGVKLLVLGEVEHAGAGCICPESTLLKTLMRHLLLERDEVAVMDMEAGLEHLARGTASAVQAMLVVVEPSEKSLQTARSIKQLAEGLGVRKIFAVANKVRNEAEETFLSGRLEDFPLLGVLPDSEALRMAEMQGKPPFEGDPDFVKRVAEIQERLEKSLAS